MAEVTPWPTEINGQPVPYGKPLGELGKMLRVAEQARVASIALAHEGSEESLRLLRPLLGSQDRDGTWLLIGLDAVAMHPLGRTEAAHVVELLSYLKPEFVSGAPHAAALLGSTEKVPYFRTALNNPEIAMTYGSRYVLLELQQPGDLATLAEQYRDGDHEERKRISEYLHTRIRPENWRKLFELFKDSDIDYDREAAARLAHEFGSAEDSSDLEILAHDGNGHVRGAACRAMAAIQSRGGIPGSGPNNPLTALWPSNLGREDPE